MPSKKTVKTKPAKTKRTSFPRRSAYSKDFKKDWDRYDATGRFDMHDLKKVMGIIIANDGPLPPEQRDHALQGGRKWLGCRECHVHGDLLVYRLEDDGSAVIFVAIGTHAELFE